MCVCVCVCVCVLLPSANATVMLSEYVTIKSNKERNPHKNTGEIVPMSSTWQPEPVSPTLQSKTSLLETLAGLPV